MSSTIHSRAPRWNATHTLSARARAAWSAGGLRCSARMRTGAARGAPSASSVTATMPASSAPNSTASSRPAASAIRATPGSTSAGALASPLAERRVIHAPSCSTWIADEPLGVAKSCGVTARSAPACPRPRTKAGRSREAVSKRATAGPAAPCQPITRPRAS
ncbi:MAG: hypothetical protein KF729_17605 [Sandaracinaceae bacterium]|nr:hypothetical protein [Sandaracinaceae bacterium]